MNSAHPIQIIKPIDHNLYLESTQLRSIFDSEELRDRDVVIVSIAGDLRKGKSFLLNFFLKYLYAQYKHHDVSDWIGEYKNDENHINGFEFRGGQKPATLGIWMWSEIFTHDDNIDGKRVAIILLDTQGIFDNDSTMKDCTAIFSISMMMSSVQCYNIMQKVQENDLQNLHLFTEYGELAMDMDSIGEKPFQKLLFVVRDWPYEHENGYGYSEDITEKLLVEKEKQALEMHLLRKRLKSSFSMIETFLLPHPGLIVQKEYFKGDVSQLDGDFIKYVKELVPSLLAPRNLTVKTINGQTMRVRDLIAYLQMYVDVFNRQKLPTPETLAMATAKANILPVFNDCLQFYTESMKSEFENNKSSYFNDTGLAKIHVNAKNNALMKYHQKRKFGGVEFIAIYQNELEIAIDGHYSKFRMKNDRMKNEHSTIKYWWNVSCMAGGVAGVAAILAPYAAGVAVLSLIRSITK